MQDANKARDDIQEILNKHEYQAYNRESQNIFAVWWEKAMKWIAEQLEVLFPSIQSAETTAGFLLNTIIVVTIAIVLRAAFLIIRNAKRKQKFRDKQPLQSMKEISWSFGKHLSEAQRFEAAGDYNSSTRHLFLALLLFFHEKEWLEARIWKTNWEYYDELRKINQAWAKEFYHLALYFDEVTYGEHIVQKDEYSQFHANVMKWLENSDQFAVDS